MVSEKEQIDFFNTIFAPLRSKVLAADVKLAGDTANEFVEGVWPVNSSPEFQDWNTKLLNETETESWKWLIGMRGAYALMEQNDKIKIHKFVWHKKPDEGGWGPKLVFSEESGDKKIPRNFKYLVKKMDEEMMRIVEDVGTDFGRFQDVEQGNGKQVKCERIENATIITVIADNGPTLDEEFKRVIFEEDRPGLDRLFQKMIDLFLQYKIQQHPSLGFVQPLDDEKLWKNQNQWKNGHHIHLNYFQKHIKNVPFLIPLRWDGDTNRCYTLLHGDEWGGNFISPSNRGGSGSIRPIDFEDAHIQNIKREEVNDSKHNITSYLKASMQDGHKMAGGLLAYRCFNGIGDRGPPPLYAYSSLSALGRLFCALIQKLTQDKDYENLKNDNWIEEATVRFFQILRKTLDDCLNSPVCKDQIIQHNLDIDQVQRGLIIRAVLAAYDWSEHWNNKSKWEESSRSEFQFQLCVQGEWELFSLDEEGRLMTWQHDYATLIQNESFSPDWSNDEKKDIEKCAKYLRQLVSQGRRQLPPAYVHLPMLKGIKLEHNSESIETAEIHEPLDKKNRLLNKINLIEAHYVSQNSEGEAEYIEKLKEYFRMYIDKINIEEHPICMMNDIETLVGEPRVTEMDYNGIFDHRHTIIRKSIFDSMSEKVEKANDPWMNRSRRRNNTNQMLEIVDNAAKFHQSLRERSKARNPNQQSEVISSRIAILAEHLARLTRKYFDPSKIVHSDIRLLTKILAVLEKDENGIERGAHLSVLFYVILSAGGNARFRPESRPWFEVEKWERWIEGKDEYVEDFLLSLSKCMKTCLRLSEERPNDSYTSKVMNIIVDAFEADRILREWAVNFLDDLDEESLGSNSERDWYKRWIALKISV